MPRNVEILPCRLSLLLNVKKSIRIRNILKLTKIHNLWEFFHHLEWNFSVEENLPNAFRPKLCLHNFKDGSWVERRGESKKGRAGWYLHKNYSYNLFISICLAGWMDGWQPAGKDGEGQPSWRYDFDPFFLRLVLGIWFRFCFGTVGFSTTPGEMLIAARFL